MSKIVCLRSLALLCDEGSFFVWLVEGVSLVSVQKEVVSKSRRLAYQPAWKMRELEGLSSFAIC